LFRALARLLESALIEELRTSPDPSSDDERRRYYRLTTRGIAETRAGLGGTYAALGGWALVSRDPTAQAAVGVVWLGAAGARIASLVFDRPRTDATFWAYLAAEIGLGAAALVGARRARLSTSDQGVDRGPR